MSYTEERSFDVRVVFRCAFGEDYEGDADGYAWAEELPAVRHAVLRAVVNALTAHPGWTLRGGSRGVAPEDEVMLVLERAYDGASDPLPRRGDPR